MGNYCECCKKERKNITLLLIGLDNAGKTTVARKLVGDSTDSVLKTLGFSLVVYYYHGYKVNLYDLGGSSQIRDIWNKYFMDAHGIIYVVDASDVTRIEESKIIFADLLCHKNIAGKPILLLGNKQDKEHTLDELEIVENMDIEYIVNKYRCPTRVEICTTFEMGSSKIDKGIKNGFRWLIDNIIENYKILNERVEEDMADYAILIQKDRDEWKRRTESNNHQIENDAIIANGNPFQPINTLIENGKKTNGGEIGKNNRTVLIDNFIVNHSYENHSFVNKTDKTNPNHRIITTTKAVNEKKNSVSQRHQHKKTFAKFNRVAPLPIDMLMRDQSINENMKEISNSSAKSCLVYGNKKKDSHILKFHFRRPATAPPKINFSSVKVEMAWDLSTPLEVATISISKNLTERIDISDSEDVVSYF